MTRQSTARAILNNWHALKERRYAGDMDAIDTLLDFETAISIANLTSRQLTALSLVYMEDLTQTSAGKRMGISRQSVGELVNRAGLRLDDVYAKWAEYGDYYKYEEVI